MKSPAELKRAGIKLTDPKDVLENNVAQWKYLPGRNIVRGYCGSSVIQTAHWAPPGHLLPAVLPPFLFWDRKKRPSQLIKTTDEATWDEPGSKEGTKQLRIFLLKIHQAYCKIQRLLCPSKMQQRQALKRAFITYVPLAPFQDPVELETATVNVFSLHLPFLTKHLQYFDLKNNQLFCISFPTNCRLLQVKN